MESKQSSFMEERKRIENIRTIVEMVTGERTISVTRYRGEVEARMIFASLLKDLGLHVESIAYNMKKSRYAADYYLKRFNDLVELDSNFKSLYVKCKDMSRLARPIYNFITEKEWMEDSNRKETELQG
jgi:hypothetical protein